MDPRTRLVSESIDKNELRQQTSSIALLLEKHLKKEDYQKSIAFLSKLQDVSNAYEITMQACMVARNSQNAFNKDLLDNKLNDAIAKIRPALDNFNLLLARIKTHYSMDLNKVPQIPIEIESQVPAEIYKQLQEARQSTVRSKTLGDSEFTAAQNENIKIKEFDKKTSQMANQINKNKTSAILTSAPQCPSFLHSNQGAQQKAAAANRPASAQPQNPSTQPKK